MTVSEMYRPRFVLRTIRHGHIRLFGRTWAPSREPCPERFNGLRGAFACYWGPRNGRTGRNTYDEYGLMDGIALWGSEKAYRGGDDWPGPFVEDNIFKWEWWKPVDEQ